MLLFLVVVGVYQRVLICFEFLNGLFQLLVKFDFFVAFISIWAHRIHFEFLLVLRKLIEILVKSLHLDRIEGVSNDY